MIIKDLIEFGLNEKGAKVYLALLELEIATVNEISKAASINRSTAYVTLESLKKHGLVSISDNSAVRQYIATPPEAILRSAEDLAISQENIRKKIERIIPEMKALYKGTKKKPIVKVFEGKDGLINAFEDTLNARGKLMRVFSSPANLGLMIQDYLPTYIKKRFDRGIKMYGIHPYDDIHKKLADQSAHTSDKYILIPENKYKFPADLAIYDNKIGYMSHENGGIAIVIESNEISDVMKSIFDLAWEEAKRLNANLSGKAKKRK
jgi:sugar-specific transcriptional regulator TrmB